MKKGRPQASFLNRVNCLLSLLSNYNCAGSYDCQTCNYCYALNTGVSVLLVGGRSGGAAVVCCGSVVGRSVSGGRLVVRGSVSGGCIGCSGSVVNQLDVSKLAKLAGERYINGIGINRNYCCAYSAVYRENNGNVAIALGSL